MNKIRRKNQARTLPIRRWQFACALACTIVANLIAGLDTGFAYDKPIQGKQGLQDKGPTFELPSPKRTQSNQTSYGALRSRNLRLPSRLKPVGDEAFTEPIETIKLAAPELGIVSKVNIKRGDIVKTQDLLVELDMSVLEASKRLAMAKANTKARLRAAEVEFESKTKSYNKRVRLLADNAGSPEEVDKAKTEVDIAQQNIEAIVEENEQYVLETKRIESQMEQRRIRSPIDGVVIDILRKPGEYVSNSDPHIATVVQLDTLRVVFHLPTAQARKIKSGDTAKLLLTETDQQAQGVVEYVAPVTSADSGRVRVEVLIENSNHKYRSGVRCRIVETIKPLSSSNMSAPPPSSGSKFSKQPKKSGQIFTGPLSR